MREIKTTLTLDGEKQFKQELEAAGREMRVMNADLKAMAAEFDSSGDAQRYFTQRSEAMTNKVKQQEEIVRALSNAVRESAEKYGSAAKQTDTYRIKLSNATEQLYRMRKEADEAERELQELGRNSEKIGRNIKEGIGDSAEDTAEKLDGMFSKIQQDVNAMKSSVAFQTTMDIGSFVLDSLQSAVDFVQESREYRRLQSFAEQSAIRSGTDIKEVERYANEIAVFFGDYDAAVETIAVLTEAGFKGETLGAAVDNLIGAAIAFYNTLNTESLAESLQETLATGEATGQYAELIERLQGQTSTTVEDINKALKKAKTDQEKLEIVMAPLTEAGMQSNKFDYEARNKELLKATEAERALQEAWADLAAEIEPIITSVIEGTTTIVDGLNEIVRRLKAFISGEDYVPMTGGSLTAEEFYAEINKAAETKEIYQTIEKLEGEIERFRDLGVNWETINEVLAEEMALLRIGISEQAAEQLNAEWLDAYFSTKNWKGREKPEGLEDKGFWDWLFPSAGAEEIPAELGQYGEEIGSTVIKGMEQGMQMEGGKTTAADAAIGTVLAQMMAEDKLEDAKAAGNNLMVSFGNGIAEGAAVPIGNVKTMVDSINSMLNQIAVPAFGAGFAGITGGTIGLYMDSQKVGALTAGSVSRSIGRGVQTKMTVN